MIQIRANCFETNSSSSHSLIITKGDAGHYTPEEAFGELYWMNDDGTWSPSGDDMYFGRSPFKVLNSFKDKLCYAYACAPTRRGKMKKSGYEGYWREYYKVTNVVRKFLGDKFEFNGIEPNYRRWNSIGTDDCLLPKWLNDANITLIEFLTNKNIFVICDGDEYCVWTDMKKFGLINMDNIKLALPEKEWWEDGYEWDEDDCDDIDVTEDVIEDYKKEGED